MRHVFVTLVKHELPDQPFLGMPASALVLVPKDQSWLPIRRRQREQVVGMSCFHLQEAARARGIPAATQDDARQSAARWCRLIRPPKSDTQIARLAETFVS